MARISYELWKCDHGIDGWDARVSLEARFTTMEKAIAYLTARDFTFKQAGSFYHALPEYRHTMGAISYEILQASVPVNPK